MKKRFIPAALCSLLSAPMLLAQSVSLVPNFDLLGDVAGFSFNNCAVDMNGDFLDDVVRVTDNGVFVDFQQPTGGFQQTVFPMNLQYLPGWSICAGDLDNNGFNDLLLGDGSGVSFVKANDLGTGYTEQAMPEWIFSQRSTMADIDNDGDLDAFVCHDVDQSHPFRNIGNGQMVLDQSLIVTSPLPGNYAAIWTDYDNDADIDLYVTKCRGGALPGDPSRTNLLYQNNGDGTFTEVGAQAGVADNAQSWSTVFEDFDNDGDFDAFIVNHDMQNRLYRNNGDGTFTDVIAGSGIDADDLGAWENASGDFNNDGFVDIFSELENELYLGNGDLTFTGQSLPVGGGGIGDFNDDGFLDVVNGSGIYVNSGNSNNWLKINTIGSVSNKNGIGARVEIYGDWGVQVREVRSGQSFAPMSSLTTYFGIGQSSSINLVVVKWPSGIVTTVENPAINATININEAGCLLPGGTLTLSGSTDICPGSTVTLTAPAGFDAYLWSNGETGQSVAAGAAGNYSVIMTDTAGCVSFSNKVTVTILQDIVPTVEAEGALQFCEGGSVVLKAVGGPNPVWSNGTAAESITVSQSGTYTVATDAICTADQLQSASVEVLVLAAEDPVISDISIMPGDSVLLTAVGDSIYWYDAPTGGNLLAVGDSYQTPPLSQATTYFVESHADFIGEAQTGGKPDNSGGGGLPTQGAFMFFNAWEPFILKSVTVYVPATAPTGQRTIQLMDANDNVLEEATLFLGPGQWEVELEMPVPAGNFLSLRCAENNLFRNTGGVDYPYPIGDVGEITGDNLGIGYYYYFYNWKIMKGSLTCISERVPVTVGVSAVDDQLQGANFRLMPNPANDKVVVEWEGNANQLRLLDVAGRSILLVNANGQTSHLLDVAALPSGFYQVQLEVDGQWIGQKLVVHTTSRP